MGTWKIQHRRIGSLLGRRQDYISEAYVHLYVNFGAFEASHEIDSESLIFLIFFDSRNTERFRIENQSVICNGLTDDLGKQPFDPRNAIFATAF